MTRAPCHDRCDVKIYEFRVCGELAADWSEWFNQFEVTAGHGETVLRGPIRDQSALYGMIAKFRNLGLTLLAVNLASPAR